MTQDNTSNASIESLLDTQLDDIADLPEFVPFPPGLHQCTLNFTSKKIGTHPAIEIKLTMIETVELSDPSAAPPAKGATTNVSYMLDNEYGAGAFKKVAKALQAHFSDATSIGAIIKEAEGCTANVVTKLREGKKGTTSEGRQYADIVDLQVA